MSFPILFEKRRWVNGLLKKRLPERFPSDFEQKLLTRLIQKGRKVRGALVLSFGEAPELADFALGIELLHAASVMVDDIVDGDIFRHGSENNVQAFGVTESALISHNAVSAAFNIFVEYGEVAKLAAEA